MSSFQEFKSVSTLENWADYLPQLQVLSMSPELIRARKKISEMQHVPDLENPENVLFAHIPLEVKVEKLDIPGKSSQSSERPTPRPDLNQKVFLWCGDVLQLQVDAFTVGTHRLIIKESSGLNEVVQEKGGSKMHDDIRFRITETALFANSEQQEVKPQSNVENDAEEEERPDSDQSQSTEKQEIENEEMGPGEVVVTRGYEIHNVEYVFFCLPPQIFHPKELMYTTYETILEKVSSINKLYRSQQNQPRSSSGSSEVKPIRSLALTCIGTGIYQYPKVLAANIGLSLVREFLEKEGDLVDQLIFVVHNARQHQIYEELMTYYFPNSYFFNSPLLSLQQAHFQGEEEVASNDLETNLDGVSFPIPPSIPPSSDVEDSS